MKSFNPVNAGIVGVFSILFAGYAVFIYPFEKLGERTNQAARKNRMKYAPDLT